MPCESALVAAVTGAFSDHGQLTIRD